MVVFNDHIPAADDGNCNHWFGSQGQKGVTIWGPKTTDIYLAPNGGSSGSLYFTFTQPRCYDSDGGTQICNVTYRINTLSSATDNDVGPIYFKINGNYNLERDRYHSKVAGHDLIETIEIVPYNLLNETGANSIEFVNMDTQVGVYIKGLTIFRTYQMCYLPCDNQTPTKCDGESLCEGKTCEEEAAHAPQPDFATRYDYPCNCDGGGVSWTDFGYDDHVKRVSPGQTVSWTWTNPENPSNNYVDRISCLFNFNNVTLSEEYSNNPDVNFRIRVNGGNWWNFFHSKLQQHQAHSVDLATHPQFASTYNDSPDASNTLELQLDAGADVDLVLCDGCNDDCPDECPDEANGGRVNIYRVYQTESVVCPPPCQVGCEVSCQTACQVSCQSGCEICQDCYVCQFCYFCYGWYLCCEATCQTGCEVECQTGCEIECQDCQTGCEVTCQTGCQVSCETACDTSCQTSCQLGCETACEIGCQEVCQLCEGGCQGCEGGCLPGCYDCEDCQTCQLCQAGCQGCEGGCLPGCYSCQDCQTCQGGCEGCYGSCVANY